MQQSIRIYTPYMDLLHETDNYLSLQFTPKFYEVGEFEVHVNQYTEGAEYFQKNNLIMLDKQKDKVGIIRHREIALDETGKLSENWKITGVALKGVLSQRVTIPPETTGYDRKSGDAETVMKYYVEKHFINPNDPDRQIDHIEVAPNKNRGAHVEWESRFKNVDEEIIAISKQANLGWIMYADMVKKKWIFDVVETRDVTQGNEAGLQPVFFSPDFQTIKTQQFIDSDVNLKNFGYVGGQGEGVDRLVEEIGVSKGLERLEAFIDARDVGGSGEEDLTAEQIQEKLTARGQSKLDEMSTDFYLEAQILTPTINDNSGRFSLKTPFEYEVDFRLGDTVQVFNKKWNITMDAPITAFKEIHEVGGFVLEATFGEAQPTLISKIKGKFDEISGIEQQELPVQIAVERMQEAKNYSDANLSVEEKARIAQAKANLAEAKANTTSAISDIDIGGRNLFRDDIFSTNVFRAERINQSGETGLQIPSSKITETLVENQEYTVSMLVKGNANIVLYRISSTGNSAIDWLIPTDISEGEFKRVYLTFKSHRPTLTALYVYTKYRSTPYTEWFEIKKDSLQLEKGNKATDHTPAPEDQKAYTDAVALAEANLAETQAKAYADGIVSDEEARAIADAQDKLALAKADAKTKADAAEAAANNYTNSQLTNYVGTTLYDNDMNAIQAQIDNQITSHFKAYEPSLTNLPASDWTTNTEKDKHIGDLFYNSTTGYSYRFMLDNTVYKWTLVRDEGIAKALQDAAQAQDTADSKRRVFVSQPTTPYDVGDLWDNGGKVYRSTVTKTTSTTFSVADWYLIGDVTGENTSADTSNVSGRPSSDIEDKKGAQSKADGAESSANTYTQGWSKQGADVTADNASKSIVLKDTRSADETPDWYYANYPKQVVSEFKYGSTFGGIGSETYGTLITRVQWSGSLGGKVKQEFTIGDDVFYRQGIGITWEVWRTAEDKAGAQAKANTAEQSAKDYRDLWAYPNTTYIDGGNIYTNSVTANEINVGSLSAISADIGNITAGSITGVDITSTDGTYSIIMSQGKITADNAVNNYFDMTPDGLTYSLQDTTYDNPEGTFTPEQIVFGKRTPEGYRNVMNYTSSEVSNSILSPSLQGARIQFGWTGTYTDRIGNMSVLAEDFLNIDSQDVIIQTSVNPAVGEPLFRVLSLDGSERLRVEHDGTTSTINSFHADGAIDTSSNVTGKTAYFTEVQVANGGSPITIREDAADGAIIFGDSNNDFVDYIAMMDSTNQPAAYYFTGDSPLVARGGNPYSYATANLYAGSYGSGSKRELKTNIEKVGKNTLDMIRNTPVYAFNYKAHLNRAKKAPRKNISFMYEEAPEEIKVGDGGISLNSSIGVLWKGEQDLLALVGQLNERITVLENKLGA